MKEEKIKKGKEKEGKENGSDPCMRSTVASWMSEPFVESLFCSKKRSRTGN
jgi:hypothetical protein